MIITVVNLILCAGFYSIHAMELSTLPALRETQDPSTTHPSPVALNSYSQAVSVKALIKRYSEHSINTDTENAKKNTTPEDAIFTPDAHHITSCQKPQKKKTLPARLFSNSLIGRTTELYHAIDRRDTPKARKIIQEIVERGWKLNAPTLTGDCVLNAAVKTENLEITQLLIEYKALINTSDTTGLTPLHLAARHGHTALATLLLCHGAEVDSVDKNGFTPLYLASSFYGPTSTAELLLKNGAHVDGAFQLCRNNTHHVTPLWNALCLPLASMANLLLEHKANLEITNRDGQTLLHKYAREGKAATVSTLINHGACKDAKTPAGQTPLDLAREHDHLGAIKALCSKENHTRNSFDTLK